MRADLEEFVCTHIGDYDLIGNKFNGHDLHLYLQAENIKAYHLVCRKDSDDTTTFALDNTTSETFFQSLVQSKYFIEADVIHMHLMHNTMFDLQHLPFISAYKPVVMTIHDPWLLGGHCIHHGDCRKWEEHCGDCPYLSIPFARQTDTSALEFAIKYHSIQHSNVHAIVASKWIEDKLKQSPVWQSKKITRIPFGINQTIFKPANCAQIRQELGLPDDALVLFARTQVHFKGLEVLQESLQQLSSQKVFLLTVGEKGLLKNLPPNIKHLEYGWLDDDFKLAKLYQAADLFLMPSERETFGMMAIEAMSCGKMVLALNGTALPDVINAPEAGIAVDKEHFASELVRLCENPAEVRKRGQAALKFALEAYNKEKYVERVIQVYREAMGSFVMPSNGCFLMDQLYKYPPLPKTSLEVNVSSRLARLKNFYYQHGAVKTALKVAQKVGKRIFR